VSRLLTKRGRDPKGRRRIPLSLTQRGIAFIVSVSIVNEGAIIERGTHDELLEAGGFYHDLYMSQPRYDAALTSEVDEAALGSDGREPRAVVEMSPTRAAGDSQGEHIR
jgi:hypothetical protein